MNVPYALDTSVLVSAALSDGTARKLVLLLAQRDELITSRFILDELLRVLQESPQIATRVPPMATARFVAFVERHARVVKPARVRWPGNPADAAVLGTAKTAQATLVTGDRVVLEAATRFRVRAVRIREALAELGGP